MGAGWVVPLLALALGATWAVGRALTRARTRARLMGGEGPDEAPRAAADELEPGTLRHWLTAAGFPGELAPTSFVASSAACTVLGCLVAAGLSLSGLPAQLARTLIELPGGYGGLLAPVPILGPWVLLATCGLVPYLVVNGRRRRRVRETEEDLPLTLELLATLSQAGLGFDAGVARILDARPEPRPLFEELRQLQRDLLSGVPRVRALRALARRLELGPISMLVSALVQAEQMGASLADVLARQAQDVRARRRADVLIKAEALTVKLVFPLVMCFMPGLFVFTLGPAFHQLFQLTASFSRGPR